MNQKIILSATVVLLFASAAVMGCTPNSAPPTTGTPEATHDHDHAHEHGHSHGEESGHEKSDMELMTAELAKLSPQDRASAEKQHFCPVSGQMLGTMGPPQKMEVNGQTVWICCSGCKDALEKNPDKYLSKLKS